MADIEPSALPDTHAHLSYIEEKLGLEAVNAVLAAYSVGGSFLLDPGVDSDDFTRRKAAYGNCPAVRLAAGIWPDAAPLKDPQTHLANLEQSVADPACRAVGECGFDFHWMHGTPAEQEALFEGQIQLARRNGLPVIVHSRDAHDATLDVILRYSDSVSFVIHCFGYGPAEVRDYLDAGCHVSFSGNSTYKRSEDLRQAIALVPDDRLLLETDAPYMNPEPGRGRPSTPMDIVRTYSLVASLRNTSVAVLGDIVRKNAVRLFG